MNAIKIKNSDKSEQVVRFNTKEEMQKAVSEKRKEGFGLLTKGWYYNRATKQDLFTSTYYYI